MNQGPYNPYSAPMPPSGGPPGYGGPPSYGGGGYGGGGRQYEFSDAENSVIASCAFWAKLLGIFEIVTGAAALLNCNIVTFGINLFIGIFLIGGASALTAVVNTQGNDIGNMMTALQKLGSAFKTRVIVTIIAVVVILLAFLGIMAIALLGAASR